MVSNLKLLNRRYDISVNTTQMTDMSYHWFSNFKIDTCPNKIEQDGLYLLLFSFEEMFHNNKAKASFKIEKTLFMSWSE